MSRNGLDHVSVTAIEPTAMSRSKTTTRLGPPRGRIDLERSDGAEDRVREQDGAGDVERVHVGLVGRQREGDTDGETDPPQPGDERSEPAEFLDRAGVEARTDAPRPPRHPQPAGARPRRGGWPARPGV